MSTSNPDKIIILTCTVKCQPGAAPLFQKNSDSRKDCYLRAIKAWLDETDLYIIVVENSNYNFPELKEYKEKYSNRFEIISFDITKNLSHTGLLTKHITCGRKSKGMLEMFSINYAYIHSQLVKKHNFNFIIKITGRFYIPTFSKFLQTTNFKKYNSMRQIICGWNRCELVGCRKEYFNILFDLEIASEEKRHINYVESIYNIRHKTKIPKDTVFICPRFKLGWNTQRGGVKEKYGSL